MSALTIHAPPQWLQKFWVMQTFFRARRRRFSHRQALEAYQERSIQHLLKQILPHSKYTASRLPKQDPSRWREMPIMTKADMMEHFNDINTAQIRLDDAMRLGLRAEEERSFSPTLNNITVGLSSGTSGHRGLFLVNPRERTLWAGEQLAHWLPTIPWRKERIAFFLRANSQLYGTLGSNHIRFVFFDLAHTLESHLEALNALKPTFLTGPPSVLAWLAKKQQQKP